MFLNYLETIVVVVVTIILSISMYSVANPKRKNVKLVFKLLIVDRCCAADTLIRYLYYTIRDRFICIIVTQSKSWTNISSDLYKYVPRNAWTHIISSNRHVGRYVMYAVSRRNLHHRATWISTDSSYRRSSAAVLTAGYLKSGFIKIP